MKKILVILIALIVVAFIIFKAVASQPPEFLPATKVINTDTVKNPVTLKDIITGSSTVNTKNENRPATTTR